MGNNELRMFVSPSFCVKGTFRNQCLSGSLQCIQWKYPNQEDMIQLQDCDLYVSTVDLLSLSKKFCYHRVRVARLTPILLSVSKGDATLSVTVS